MTVFSNCAVKVFTLTRLKFTWLWLVDQPHFLSLSAEPQLNKIWVTNEEGIFLSDISPAAVHWKPNGKQNRDWKFRFDALRVTILTKYVGAERELRHDMDVV